jgi:hypothetical protein
MNLVLRDHVIDEKHPTDQGEPMRTPRQTYTEACEQLEREAIITICAKVALPDGTAAVVDWPEEWKPPTYADAEISNGVELPSDVMELVFQAMGQVVRAKLGPYPAPTAEERQRFAPR